MTKYKYIITSAYTGQSKEVFGDRSERGSTVTSIFEGTEVVAIVPLALFMIEISVVKQLSDAERVPEILKNKYGH